MTDAEIIRALECCEKGFANCDGCPYDDDNNYCVTKDGKSLIIQDALYLIKRQKAEIERLKKFCDIYSTEGERAVKQFVAWFKKRAMATRKDNDGNCRYDVDDKFIDKLLEEVVGESDV